MENNENKEVRKERGAREIFKLESTKTVLFIAAIIMIMLWAVLNYKAAFNVIAIVIGLIMPFIVGLCFAFILNVFLGIVETKVFTNIEHRLKEESLARRLIAKCKRIASIIISLAVVFGLISFFIFKIVPELKVTVEKILAQIPSHASDLKQLSENISESFGLSFDIYDLIIQNKNVIGQRILDFLANGAEDITTAALDATMSIFSGVATVVIGFVFAIYLLLSKEKLLGQVRALTVAYCSEKVTTKIFRTVRLATQVFTGFVKGQFLESVIIAFLVFVGTLIIAPSYAVMFAVLLGVCGFIPVVGAILATAFAAVILLADDPWKALIFVIYIIAMQQVESNVIYPRVVGHTMSLPGIWVLLAVIAGGAFAGVVGVVVGVPLCAFIYSLLKDSVRTRLIEKQMNAAKIDKMVKESFEKIHPDGTPNQE